MESKAVFFSWFIWYWKYLENGSKTPTSQPIKNSGRLDFQGDVKNGCFFSNKPSYEALVLGGQSQTPAGFAARSTRKPSRCQRNALRTKRVVGFGEMWKIPCKTARSQDAGPCQGRVSHPRKIYHLETTCRTSPLRTDWFFLHDLFEALQTVLLLQVFHGISLLPSSSKLWITTVTTWKNATEFIYSRHT